MTAATNTTALTDTSITVTVVLFNDIDAVACVVVIKRGVALGVLAFATCDDTPFNAVTVTLYTTPGLRSAGRNRNQVSCNSQPLITGHAYGQRKRSRKGC